MALDVQSRGQADDATADNADVHLVTVVQVHVPNFNSLDSALKWVAFYQLNRQVSSLLLKTCSEYLNQIFQTRLAASARAFMTRATEGYSSSGTSCTRSGERSKIIADGAEDRFARRGISWRTV